VVDVWNDLRELPTFGSLVFDVFLSCGGVGAFGVVSDNMMDHSFPNVPPSLYFNNNNIEKSVTILKLQNLRCVEEIEFSILVVI